MSNERECCSQCEAAKVPRLAPAGAPLCPCSHICIVTSPEFDSWGSAGTMQMIHMGRGGGGGQCRNWGIKYPNNCTGLYSDLIEIISSCFVSLFQGCISHFSPEQLGSLCCLGGGTVTLSRKEVIHLFRHMQQYAAHPWIIMKANIYTFSKPFFSQTKALVSSCH